MIEIESKVLSAIEQAARALSAGMSEFVDQVSQGQAPSFDIQLHAGTAVAAVRWAALPIAAAAGCFKQAAAVILSGGSNFTQDILAIGYWRDSIEGRVLLLCVAWLAYKLYLETEVQL